MNNLDGFEDLPIGFLQAMYEFYMSIEGNPPNSLLQTSIGDIPEDLRSPIIKGHYFTLPTPLPTPIQPSDIFSLGEKLGLDNYKILSIVARRGLNGKR